VTSSRCVQGGQRRTPSQTTSPMRKRLPSNGSSARPRVVTLRRCSSGESGMPDSGWRSRSRSRRGTDRPPGPRRQSPRLPRASASALPLPTRCGWRRPLPRLILPCGFPTTPSGAAARGIVAIVVDRQRGRGRDDPQSAPAGNARL
jgi:hypothetical protein